MPQETLLKACSSSLQRRLQATGPGYIQFSENIQVLGDITTGNEQTFSTLIAQLLGSVASCIDVIVTIPAITPTFSSTSRPTASPEVPRDTSSSHMPLGSHVIHPRAPSSRPMLREPVSRPHWVRLRESPLSTPNAPDEPEGSADPRIDSAVLTEDLSILQGLLSGLPI